MEVVPLLPVEGFAPWAEYLYQCENLRASGIRLVEDFNADRNQVYLCIEVPRIYSESVDLNFTSAHITIGTYRIGAGARRRRLSTQAKAETLCRRLIREARARTEYFDKSGAHVRLKHWTGEWCSGVPAIFTLRICEAAFALDRLVANIQSSMEGVFEVVHRAGPRTMLHLRGPTLHLSIYSDVHVERH